MLEKIVNAVKGFVLGILPNLDLKKLLWSVGAAVVSYVLLAFVVKPILSLNVIYLAGAVAVGYIVYTKVAMWEIQKVVDGAKDLVK